MAQAKPKTQPASCVQSVPSSTHPKVGTWSSGADAVSLLGWSWAEAEPVAVSAAVAIVWMSSDFLCPLSLFCWVDGCPTGDIGMWCMLVYRTIFLMELFWWKWMKMTSRQIQHSASLQTVTFRCRWLPTAHTSPRSLNVEKKKVDAVQIISMVDCNFVVSFTTWVMRCWHGCLSGAGCKWFAFGSTDAIAVPSFLASLKFRIVFTVLMLAYPGCAGKKTTHSELQKVLFFGTVSLWFFVCVWNVSETAQWICTKFIQKTSFVPRSDEFEGQAQRSRSSGTKMTLFSPWWPVCGLVMVW